MRRSHLSNRVSDWVAFIGWWVIMALIWFISTGIIGFILGITYRVLMMGWSLV